MATWQKIIVSGSNISQLNNDSNFLLSSGDGVISGSSQIGAEISGSSTALSSSLAARVAANESFSSSLDASFASESDLNTATSSLSSSLATDIATNKNTATAIDGEVANLMAATGSQYAHVANLNTFTGSAARRSAISGSITSFSSSIAGRVTTEENNVDVAQAHIGNIHSFTASADGEITSLMDFTGSAARSSAITGSSTALSSSLAGRITTAEAELGNTLISSSAQIAADISGSSTALSASIASDVATNKNNATALDGEVTNLMAATGSQYAHIASINAFTASAGRRVAISGSFTTVSGSIATRLTEIEGTTTNNLLSSSAQIATDISGSSTALSSSIAGRVTTNEVEIDALQAFSQSVDTALDFDGTNVTVTGNLTVAGTQTAVDSNVLDIGDNIIALNGTGATKGGLAVNDADGPSSGSLLWDGSNNYWVAGATGSEVKILRETGDGVLSGSAQIATNISGSQTALSSSIATRVTTNEVNDAKLDAEVTSLMGATGSAYAHIDNLNDFTASAGRRSAISGSFTTISGSFATRITTTDATATALDGEVTNLMAATGSQFAHIANLNTFTGSAGRKSAISGSSTALSASIASDIATNLATATATDGEVTSLMAQTASYALAANITGSSTSLSASLSNRIANITSTFDIDANTGTADTVTTGETLTFTGTGPITTAVSDNTITIDVTDSVISGSATALSASIASDIANITSTFDIAADTGTADTVTTGETLTFTGAGPITTAVSDNTITIDVSDSVISGSSTALSSSIAGRVTTNETEIDELQSFSQSVDTALNFDGANVTVAGNLTVSGTTTTVDSTTLDIGDNIISLNGTGATKGGLAVNDANGPSSGSLLWDGTNNYWVAGATGSEIKILLEEGDGILSSSAQIATDISGSSTSLSSSIATRVTTVETTATALDGEVANLMAATGSQYAHIGNLNTKTGSIETNITALESFSSSLSSTVISYTGSFIGDGSQLTGVDVGAVATVLSNFSGQTSVAVTHNFGTKNVLATVYNSSDAQIIPASIVTTNDNVVTVTFDEATSGRIIVGKGGHIVSGSIPFSNLLNIPTLLSSSAQIAVDISGSSTSLSSSIASRVTTNTTNATALDGEVTNLMSATGSQYAHIANLNTFTGSATRKSAISGSSTALSASIASDIAGITTSFTLSDGSTTDTFNSGETLTFAGTANEIETTVSNNQVQIGLPNDVTITGNLTVSGTTTTVDSTTVDIGDNIIALNGTGATKGGLAVNDADGPSSGSLLWDGSNNYWVAGATGSEVKILLEEGDGILSSSAQIATNISGSSTALSASLSNRIANITSTFDIDADSGTADTVTTGETITFTGAGPITTTVSNNTITIDVSDSVISGSFTALSSSIASRVTTEENNVDVAQAHIGNIHAFTASADGEITALMAFTGSAARASAISGSTTTLSSSLAGRVTANEVFSSSLDATFASEAELNTVSASVKTFATDADTTLSASIATDVATNKNNATALDGEVTNLMAATGSQYAHIGNLNDFTGSAARRSAISGSTTSLSSSIASDIATNLANITTLEGKTIVSASSIASTGQGEVQLTTNGVAATTVDLGLQSTDSPTFAGLTVAGDLTVTGNTIEAQVTNLNVEDKYILLNSGSTSGDSGIVFGGADGVANSGVGLFWDSSYNTNDGRLGVVNSIAAGATGDQTPSYHIAGVYEGSSVDAATAQADHVGNIRVESGEIFIYV